MVKNNIYYDNELYTINYGIPNYKRVMLLCNMLNYVLIKHLNILICIIDSLNSLNHLLVVIV